MPQSCCWLSVKEKSHTLSMNMHICLTRADAKSQAVKGFWRTASAAFHNLRAFPSNRKTLGWSQERGRGIEHYSSSRLSSPIFAQNRTSLPFGRRSITHLLGVSVLTPWQLSCLLFIFAVIIIPMFVFKPNKKVQSAERSNPQTQEPMKMRHFPKGRFLEPMIKLRTKGPRRFRDND